MQDGPLPEFNFLTILLYRQHKESTTVAKKSEEPRVYRQHEESTTAAKKSEKNTRGFREWFERGIGINGWKVSERLLLNIKV
ncbi:10061_t:CDS:2 [Paraglomus brasilianum]|uniref:10061_t:CDS:1 n=1 Tax=Paraglomus brasilianum TaxID=144538 RepID=A0A9N8WRJ2_9GLOM|nr:10061_t:CDS:2 [Paraglomus brasilianum]